MATEVSTAKDRRWPTVTVVNLTHGWAHLTSQATNALFPVLREQFGFGYTGIALLSVATQLVEGPTQMTFGALTRRFRRTRILGVGTLTAFLGMLILVLSQGYGHLMAAKVVRGLGASPNHPVGGAMMVYTYPKHRAKALAAHQSIGNVGGWVAPFLIAGLLYLVDWRYALLALSLPMLFFAIAFFFSREPKFDFPEAPTVGGRRRRMGLHEYSLVLRDRNARLLALVLMVGAAGRGTGALNTYLAVIMVDRFGVSASTAAIFLGVYTLGGVAGPFALGWLADRTSSRLAVRLDLALSAVFGLLILVPQTPGVALVFVVFFAGFFIFARTTLIQATLINMAPEGTRVDTHLSLFFTLSAATGPGWLLLTGLLVDNFGIAPALWAMAASYIVGLIIMSFLRSEPPKNGANLQAQTPAHAS